MTSPATKTPAKITAKIPKERPWMMIMAGGVVVVALIVWGVARLLADPQPRLNDNAVVLSKFIYSDKFAKLDFEQQRQFYKVMDDREAEIDDAFEKKRLTESEYRVALEAAWLGKHVNRVEKYHALSPGQPRRAYIDKLLDKKEAKRAKKAKSGSTGDDIDADETVAEMKVEKWPPAIRQQWAAFHDTYRAEKKAREKAAEPQTKPAG